MIGFLTEIEVLVLNIFLLISKCYINLRCVEVFQGGTEVVNVLVSVIIPKQLTIVVGCMVLLVMS